MRTRYLKPGFFENEELAKLPPYARLLYAGLWLMADRKGRLADRPSTIKGNLFPHEDKLPVERYLQTLAKAHFIERYEAQEKKVIWIPTFHVHQRPHMKEVVSVLPPHPREQEIIAAQHQPEDDPNTDPGDDPSTDPRLVPSTPRERGKGKGESDPGKVIQGKGNQPQQPAALRPPSLGFKSAEDWDFARALYERIEPLDDRKRDDLRGLFDEVPEASWLFAAINQAALADHPGFGYVKRVVEDCLRTNRAPSTLNGRENKR